MVCTWGWQLQVGRGTVSQHLASPDAKTCSLDSSLSFGTCCVVMHKLHSNYVALANKQGFPENKLRHGDWPRAVSKCSPNCFRPTYDLLYMDTTISVAILALRRLVL